MPRNLRNSIAAFFGGPVVGVIGALGGLLTCIAAVRFAEESRRGWMWLFLAAMALVVLAFWRFHKMRLERDAAFERARAGAPEAETDPREALITFLKEQRDEALGIVGWIESGLSGSEYNDARGTGDDWANPIFLRLLQYDNKLASTFNDDGGQRFTSTQPGEFMDRRVAQLGKVIAELETPTLDRKRIGLKDLIGRARARGEELNDSRPTSFEVAAQWETNTKNLIEAALGTAEAIVFVGETGRRSMTPGSHSSWYIERIKRLDDLITRVDHIVVRQYFDPQDWADWEP